MKRGQVSIEYIMIIGLLLLVTIPLFVYAFIEVRRSIQMNHAEDAVNTLANAADTVYAMGSGSKKYVWITTPGGVTQTSVTGNEISLKLYIFGGVSDVFATTKPTVTGGLPAEKGPHRIAVESLGSGLVRIGEVSYDGEAPKITKIYPEVDSGEKLCAGTITIGADTDEAAECKFLKDEDYESNPDWEDDWHKDETILGYDNDFEGKALSHYYTDYHSEGIYSYYARCEDYAGNFMDYPLYTSPGDDWPTDKTVNITFEVGTPCIGAAGPGGLYGPGGPCEDEALDLIPPVVHLDSPLNYQEITGAPVVTFKYWVTDMADLGNPSEGIAYCVLNISTFSESLIGEEYPAGDDPLYTYMNVYDLTPSITTNPDTPILNEIIYSFADKGWFNWNIFCVDASCASNKGISTETEIDRKIKIDKTFFEAFLTSCAGWCGYAGQENGRCDTAESQCSNYCTIPREEGVPQPPISDLYNFDDYTHFTGPKCLAGNNGYGVSDAYCSGEPSKVCCCVAKEICTGGEDEDEDDVIDCADPDCFDDDACKETDCDDGIDNDGDGYKDCCDTNCANDAYCFNTERCKCNDDIDNDEDGKIDCCDTDCYSTPVDSNCGTERCCDDGIDNDNDGKTDCDDTQSCKNIDPIC